MKKVLLSITSIVLVAVTYIQSASACTDFRVVAKDGSVVIARSLEFAQDLASNLRNSLHDRAIVTTAPNGKPGMSWRAKYGYLYLDGMNLDYTVDGMNEQGLSFEYLYMPGETQYPAVPAGHENQALPYMRLGDWVLANFKSVEEVRQALSKVYVYEGKLPGMGDTVFPLHAAIYDASGKGIVVEFVGGKMQVYDNPLGVMTNAPGYDWHMTNLRNYINLTPLTPSPKVAQGMVFVATGQGAGMFGVPGDVSPPSRFVKVALMLQSVFQVNDATAAVNLAEHIMNNVDIPLGWVREAKTGVAVNELTQWAVFKDLTHKQFYYRTYGNLSLRVVSMAGIDFSNQAPLFKMPLTKANVVQDVTGQLVGRK